MSRIKFSIVLGICLLPFLFYYFESIPRRMTELALAGINPIVRTFDKVASSVENLTKKTLFPDSWEDEKAELDKKILNLEHYIVRMEELEDENQRLRDLLDFQKQVEPESLPARVVGYDISDWRKSIVINRGMEHGLKCHLPVVNPYGLVGMVVEVGKTLSRVILVTDPNFKISALIQQGRHEGIVKGTGRPICEMSYVGHDIDVREHDSVLSSGLGGIFPKGLIIGGVRSVALDRGGLFQKLEIEPSVNVVKLEEVLVLFYENASVVS